MGTGLTSFRKMLQDSALVLELAVMLVCVPLAGQQADNSGGTAPRSEASAAKTQSSVETIDPTSVNANCYVCHMAFVREPISKVHFQAKVTCVECHGLSAAHVNDENIGATKPDIRYRRDQIDAMCGRCHEQHNVPPASVIARFLERKPSQSPVVCTDCHGSHRIARAAEDQQ